MGTRGSWHPAETAAEYEEAVRAPRRRTVTSACRRTTTRTVKAEQRRSRKRGAPVRRAIFPTTPCCVTAVQESSSRRRAAPGRQRSSSAGAVFPCWNERGCDGNASRDDCGGGLTDQGGALQERQPARPSESQRRATSRLTTPHAWSGAMRGFGGCVVERRCRCSSLPAPSVVTPTPETRVVVVYVARNE